MWRITASFLCSSNGILPVKTSAPNIPKANTSAAFDSIPGILFPLREGSMISGASHLEGFNASLDTAAYVKRGSCLMGANPYSVKRARPVWSTTTLAYRIESKRAQRWKLKDNAGEQENTYPLEVTVRNIERMKVLQTIRGIKYLLTCVGRMGLVICHDCHDNGSPSHQRCARCVGVRRYVLTDVAVFSPVINEGELKERRVDPVKR